MLYEELVHEHRADLRREAATRAQSRAGRAAPRPAERVARRLRTGLLGRPVAAVGCEA